MDYKNESVWLMKGDCLERMKEIPSGSVDMVLTDPPYGTTACKWDSIIPLEPMWERLKRIIKPNGAIVMTASQPFTSVLVYSNMDMFSYEWVWVKSKITGVLNAKKMPVRKHECVLVFCDNKCTGTYNAQGLVKKGTITKQGGNSENYGSRNSSDYIQEFTNWPRDVLDIKSEGMSNTEIGLSIGMDKSVVGRVVKGESKKTDHGVYFSDLTLESAL